jgi:DNA-binding GntR family transcriptional regulator
LDVIGERYHEHRRQIMLARQEGLTKTYNRFHDSDETSADIQKLRELHVEMDQAVAAAYGWTDLNLDHGFHETKQGVRFTISEPARREVLQRLLKLNHERYAEEVKQGLHEKKGRGTSGEGRGKKKSASQPAKQEARLFDGEDDE